MTRRTMGVAASAVLAIAVWTAPAGAVVLEERSVTPDGRSILFKTAKPLSPDDQDLVDDLYVWTEGDVRLVSTGPVEDPTPSGFGMRGWFISNDGSRVLFETFDALTADDTDGSVDVYERHGGETTLVSTGPTDPGAGLRWELGEQGIHLSGHAAGGSVAFFTTLGRMVPEDDDDARDVYKRENGVTTLLSTDANGRNTPAAYHFVAASSGGARVLMSTTESLLREDRDGGRRDTYAREGAALELVTKGSIPGGSSDADIDEVTSDARSVVFSTADRLVPADTDTIGDLYQRRGTTTRLISANEQGLSLPCAGALTDPAGVNACLPISSAQSEDGAHVLFQTPEPLASADRNNARDLYDRFGSTTEWVSVGAQSNEQTSGEVLVRGAAPRVLFETNAGLAPADDDLAQDVYQRLRGQTTLISTGPSETASAHTTLEGASADGTLVLFATSASLLPEDTDGQTDLYERFGETTRLVSTGPIGGNGPYSVALLGLSDDGSRAFFTTEERLTADDTDEAPDIYMRSGGQTTLISAPSARG